MHGSSPRGLREHPVLILGSLFPALGTLHALTAKGVDCWVCCWERGVASWSRHARYVRIPDPRLDDRATVKCLRTLSKQVGGTPVVVPTDDYYAQALAKHRSDLEDLTIPCVADGGTVELLVSQLEFSKWGAANAISSPRAVQANSPDISLSLPLVAKPINKSEFRIVAQKSGEDAADFRFALLETEEQLKRYAQRHFKHLHHIVLQEFIPGTTADMYSVGIYADRNSRVLGTFVGRKIRGYPAMYGNTKLGQNDCVPAAVLDEVNRIVRQLAYRGIAEFEYRRDPRTGHFRLIEINPRCWSWIGVTAFSQSNIPWIAYQDLIGLGTAPVVDNAAPGRLKYVQIMSDCANVFLRYRWDHPAWLLSPRSWWNSLKAERLMIAEFHRGDWPIALVCFAMLCKNARLLIQRRLKGS
jgi:D-aspartate ligase